MSLLCIGATKHLPNGHSENITDDFFKSGYVFLTYDPTVGATLYQTLNQAHTGTLIAVKSFSVQHGLYIKALGLIADQPNTEKLTSERKVKWIWKGNHCFGRMDDKLDNVRSGALYQELNTDLIQQIVNLLFWKF